MLKEKTNQQNYILIPRCTKAMPPGSSIYVLTTLRTERTGWHHSNTKRPNFSKNILETHHLEHKFYLLDK